MISVEPIEAVGCPRVRAYELTVVSKPFKGLTDANGVYLYGPGTIQPGTEVVLTFD